MALREILAKFTIQVDSGELDRALASINDMVGTIRQLVSAVDAVETGNMEELGEVSGESADQIEELGDKTEKAGKSAQKSEGWFGKLRGQLVALAPAIGAAALVSGFASMAEEVDHLAKTASALNIPIGKLQAWQRAANRAGLDSAVLETGLSKIQKKAYDADTAGGALGKAFDRLGVSVKNSDGSFKSADVLFQEVGAGLAGIDDQTEKTALSMLLFEEQGAKFLNLFGQSPEAIAATLAEMEKLGGVTPEFAKDIEAMNDAWGDVKTATLGATVTLIGSLIPALTWISEKIETVTVAFRESAEGTALFESAAAVLGVAVLAKAVPAIVAWTVANQALLLSMAPWIAGIALAVLVIDDLITAWKGGDSLIFGAMSRIFDGQLLDDFLYVADEFLTWLGGWLDSIGAHFELAFDDVSLWLADWIDGVSGDFSSMVDKIAGFFSDMGAKIVENFSGAIGSVTSMVKSIPGASLLFGSGGGNATAPAPSGGGSSTNNVRQDNTIHVTVPAGTPADMARNVGGAVRGAMSAGLKPAQASLAPGF